MRNFILISGGPGIYDSADPDSHDMSWSNYVDCPLLLSKDATPPVLPIASDEEIWWFVFKPAYEERWTADIARVDQAGKKAVKDVQDAGFASYIDLIKDRASQRSWNLRWLSTANDIWTKLNTFNDPISKVYYWGHARDDLWLSVNHNAAHVAVTPASDRKVLVSDVTANVALKPKFQAGDASRIHKFFGCNTKEFAAKWHDTFGCHTEGVDGKIDFANIPTTGGEPALSTGASWHRFDS